MKTRLSLISLAISLGLLSFTNVYAVESTQSIQLSPTGVKVTQIEPLIHIDQPAVKLNIAASLVIINSHEAILSGKKNNVMTLTLHNVEPYITKFTGGTNRKVSLTAIADIIHDWTHDKTMINTSKPTAALAGMSIINYKKNPHFILELSNPVYDAKHASLTFQVKWTGGTPAPQDNMTLTNVSLVVDDGLQVALNTKMNSIKNSFLASAKS